MCCCPIRIKNVNYKSDSPYSCIQDTEFQYMYMPCGNCSECLHLKQQFIIQRSIEESKVCHLIFFTLTYKNEYLRFLDINGYKHYYADITDIQNMFKRLRKLSLFPSFKYLVVTEYGGDRHRPHFHGILFIPKSDADDEFTSLRYSDLFEDFIKSPQGWSRNFGSTRAPLYRSLSLFIRRCNALGEMTGTYDVHPVGVSYHGRVSDPQKVPFYVTKYVLKFDKWVDCKRKKLQMLYDNDELFFSDETIKVLESFHVHRYGKRFAPKHEGNPFYMVWQLLKPRILLSKGFGLGVKGLDGVYSSSASIRSCIDFSLKSDSSPFPNYYDDSGYSYPLSPYFRKKYMTVPEKVAFLLRDPNTIEFSGSHFSPDMNIEFVAEKKRKMLDFEKQCDEISMKNSRDFFGD